MGIIRAVALRVLGKRSSSRTASLAADYIDLGADDLLELDAEEAAIIAKDVRSLSASVLSQSEPKE